MLMAALLPLASADETRYVGMLDEPCSVESDEYGSLKLCYVPFKVVIDAGSTIMWENVGDQVHTVTSGTLLEPTGQFNSGLIAPNSSWSLEFTNEGLYPYYCMMHPWMNGSVTVGEKMPVEEVDEHLEELDEMVVILEDGQFTNSTGTYWANGTAVVPEFGAITMVVLATAVIGTIIITRGRLTV
tara:strand:+ start:285 stop:839 length:555 start_codon:yes stop_codon:yes gene_type:complete